MKLIDVSAYQGKIDWNKVCQNKEIRGVIHRSTVRSGKLDARYCENLNSILRDPLKNITFLGAYKFSYATDYIDAYVEAYKTLEAMDRAGSLMCINRFFLDLENWQSGAVKHYTPKEANEVIKGYIDAAKEFNVNFGLYCNYDYLKHIIDPECWSHLYLWYARYNKTMGDIEPFKARIWQYTSKGKVDGITGDVDMNEVIEL